MAEDIERLIVALETRTRAFEKGLESARDKADRQMAAIEGRAQLMARRMETAMAAALTAFASARIGGEGLQVAGDYEAAMGRVSDALTATAEEMRALNAAARELGRSPLGVTAREAADGIEMLAKNGISARDIMDGAAQASLTLARAMGVELGSAADLATDVMGQFGVTARDLPRIADQIVGMGNASKFGFQDLKDAIANAGGVAATAGLDFEELAAAISGTASQFSSGADAGTSLKTFLMSLSPTSKEARVEIERLGLSFYTSQGQLKPMTEIAEGLRRAMSGLSEEAKMVSLKTIFGTDAIRSAAALADQGAAGIERLTAAIGKISAQQHAENRMNGLNGSLRALSAAWEDLLLTIANNGGLQAATAAIERLTTAVAYLATNFQEISPWMERLGVGLATILIARGLAPAAAKAMEAGAKLIALARNAGTATVGIRGLGIAAGALGGPLGIILTLAGVTFLEMQRGAKSAEERLEAIAQAAANVEQKYGRVAELDRQIAADRETLKKASEDYAAALRGEGDAAQTAAAMEIDAINKRIAGREALRAAMVDEINLEAMRARREMESLQAQLDASARDAARRYARLNTPDPGYVGMAEANQLQRHEDSLANNPAIIAAEGARALAEARDAVSRNVATSAQSELVRVNSAMQQTSALYDDLIAKAEAVSKPLKLAEPVTPTTAPKPDGSGALPVRETPGGGSTAKTAADALRDLRTEIASASRELEQLRTVSEQADAATGAAGLKAVDEALKSAEAQIRIQRARQGATVPEGASSDEAEEIRNLAGAFEELKIAQDAMRDGIRERQKGISDGIDADKKAQEAGEALQAYFAKLDAAAEAQGRLLAAAQESDDAHAEAARAIEAETAAAAALEEVADKLTEARKAGVVVTEEEAEAMRAAALSRAQSEHAVRAALEDRRKAEKAAAEAKKRDEGAAELAAYVSGLRSAAEAQERLLAAAQESEAAHSATTQALAAETSAAETLEEAETKLKAAQEAGVVVSDELAASVRAAAAARVEAEKAVREALETRRREEGAATLDAYIAELATATEAQNRLLAAVRQGEAAHAAATREIEAETAAADALKQAEEKLKAAKEAGVVVSDELAASVRAAALARVEAEKAVRDALEERQRTEKATELDRDLAKAERDLAEQRDLLAALGQSVKAYEEKRAALAAQSRAADALRDVEEKLTAAEKLGVAVAEDAAERMRRAAVARVEAEEEVRKAVEARQQQEEKDKAIRAALADAQREASDARARVTDIGLPPEVIRAREAERRADERLRALDLQKASPAAQDLSAIDAILSRIQELRAALAEPLPQPQDPAPIHLTVEDQAREVLARPLPQPQDPAPIRLTVEDQAREALAEPLPQPQDPAPVRLTVDNEAARAALTEINDLLQSIERIASPISAAVQIDGIGTISEALEAAASRAQALRGILQGAVNVDPNANPRSESGSDDSGLREQLRSKEMERLTAEAEAEQRESALKFLEAQASAEETLNRQIRETLALQAPLADLIRDRARAHGDAEGAANAEAEAQRLIASEVRQLELAKTGLDEVAKFAGDGLGGVFI